MTLNPQSSGLCSRPSGLTENTSCTRNHRRGVVLTHLSRKNSLRFLQASGRGQQLYLQHDSLPKPSQTARRLLPQHLNLQTHHKYHTGLDFHRQHGVEAESNPPSSQGKTCLRRKPGPGLRCSECAWCVCACIVCIGVCCEGTMCTCVVCLNSLCGVGVPAPAAPPAATWDDTGRRTRALSLVRWGAGSSQRPHKCAEF